MLSQILLLLSFLLYFFYMPLEKRKLGGLVQAFKLPNILNNVDHSTLFKFNLFFPDSSINVLWHKVRHCKSDIGRFFEPCHPPFYIISCRRRYCKSDRFVSKTNQYMAVKDELNYLVPMCCDCFSLFSSNS